MTILFSLILISQLSQPVDSIVERKYTMKKGNTLSEIVESSGMSRKSYINFVGTNSIRACTVKNRTYIFQLKADEPLALSLLFDGDRRFEEK